jgi:8-oxo-dGTP pyrophosphatase MutT (NUDIX family)
MDWDPQLAAIARALEGRDPVRAEPGSYGIEAAVAACLRPGDAAPELLFIRRARHDGDPWSGHVALPGGRRESGDGSLWETAVRETREETGLDLAALGLCLGRLDDVHPRTRVLPSIAITPFVVAVPRGAEARTGPEVEAVAWIPLPELVRPERRAQVEVYGAAGPRTHPSIRYADYEIWGLTHRIVTQLLELAFPSR